MINLDPLNIDVEQLLEGKLTKKLAEPLLVWYDEHARDLPWRENVDPYRVWVSEIMLQQTRVEAVKPYFVRFIERLPTIKDLASVDEETLMKLWEGLGYYSRVRNMQKAAQMMVEQYEGKLPATYDQLLALPGIGEYTAGAVGSIAYGLKVPAVDGNVYRVFSRVFASGADIGQNKVKKAFYQLTEMTLPEKRVGDYNQALMELGATICIPKGVPLCHCCPISQYCQARKLGCAEKLPYKAPKKGRKIEKRTVLVVIADGKVLLHKRPDKGLLAGLWELPNVENWLDEQQLIEQLSQLNLQSNSYYKLLESKHVFSHIEWLMEGYLVSVQYIEPLEGYRWVSFEEWEKSYALPMAFKAYSEQFPKWLGHQDLTD